METFSLIGMGFCLGWSALCLMIAIVQYYDRKHNYE